MYSSLKAERIKITQANGVDLSQVFDLINQDLLPSKFKKVYC